MSFEIHTIKLSFLLPFCILFFSCGNEKGCISGNCIDGRGTFVYKNGNRYIGEFKEGLRQGKGMLFFSNHKRSHLEGNFLNDTIVGVVTCFLKNGDIYQGSVNQKYEFHGEGSLVKNKDSDLGQSIYDGSWVKNEKQGRGNYYYSDKDPNYPNAVYRGDWKHDKRDGNGYMTYGNGDIYEGKYRNNMRHGIGMIEFAKGGRYGGAWKEDLYHGFGTFFYSESEDEYYRGEWKRGYYYGKGTLVKDDEERKGYWKWDEKQKKYLFSENIEDIFKFDTNTE